MVLKEAMPVFFGINRFDCTLLATPLDKISNIHFLIEQATVAHIGQRWVQSRYLRFPQFQDIMSDHRDSQQLS